MSENSQPVSSRRALREKRRAEMEALLANSQAEQAAKEQAAAEQKDEAAPAAKKPSPAPETPAPAKPAAKPVADPKPASAKPAVRSEPARPGTSKTGAAKPAASKPEVSQSAAAKPAAEKKPDQAKLAAAKPKESPVVPESAEAGGERASLRRARDREALRERRRLEEEVGALTTNIPTVSPADDPKPLTRRQLRLQALAQQGGAEVEKKPASKPSKQAQPSDDDAPETTVMSVEEALAARRAHTPPASAPVDPNLLGEDDSEIDLEVLAHQREMAARAAIISRRAAERERLRVQNAKQGKDDSAPDPFTGALGNIREVEDRIAKTGVSGPKTESVSLSFAKDAKQAPSAAPAKSATKPDAKPDPKPVAKAPAKPAPKPAAAKSAAKPASKPAAKPTPKPAVKPESKPAAKSPAKDPTPASAPVEMPRIEAVNAQGLQPLDVQTHGVRRANNMLIAMIVALSVGGAALIAGLIMLFTN